MALVKIDAINQTGLPAPLTQLMVPNGVVPASTTVTLTDTNPVEEILRDGEVLNYIQTNTFLLAVNDVTLTKEQSLAFLDSPTVSVKTNLGLTALAPTSDDDETAGYSVGSMWVTTTSAVYVCADASPGAALWDHLLSQLDSINDLSDVDTVGAAHGDILYFDGTNWTELAAGTANSLLATQGPGAAPVWKTPNDAIRRFFSYSFTGSSGSPYIESTSTTYQIIGYFEWPGTNVVETLGTLGAVVQLGGGASMAVRVFDETNQTVIAELTGISATSFTAVDLGTVSNITATAAVWTIQVRGLGGGRKARIAAFTGIYG
jgi:hypothetical protein